MNIRAIFTTATAVAGYVTLSAMGASAAVMTPIPIASSNSEKVGAVVRADYHDHGYRRHHDWDRWHHHRHHD